MARDLAEQKYSHTLMCDAEKEIISQSIQRLTIKLNHVEMETAPKRFRQARLSDLHDGIQNKVKDAIDKNIGLFLYGKRGRGKTHLAWAVYRYLMIRAGVKVLNELWQQRHTSWGAVVGPPEAERYISCAYTAALSTRADIVFCNTSELLDSIKQCFEKESTVTKQEVVRQYANVRSLFLDDIGMEKYSAFVQETFDNIVDERWSEERLTVFTSNLSFDELEAHYNDHGRISSRIAGMCVAIELVGDDRRVRGQHG